MPLDICREVDRPVQLDPEGVIVLPGYPKVVEGGLQVAFSLLLPHLVNAAEGSGALISAAVLEEITLEGKNYIEQFVGKVVSVSQFSHPTSTTLPQHRDANVVGIAAGTFAGSCCGVVAAIL